MTIRGPPYPERLGMGIRKGGETYASTVYDSSRRVRNESACLAGATCVTGSMLSARDEPHLEICDGLQTIFGDDAAGLSTYVEGSNDAPTLTIFSLDGSCRSDTRWAGLTSTGRDFPTSSGPCVVYESGEGWNRTILAFAAFAVTTILGGGKQ